MEATKHILTEETYKRYREELDDLVIEGRRRISKAIQEAREMGDLSENAEYDAAREAQLNMEIRIKELEEILNNATIIDASNVDISKVHIGCYVEIEDKVNNNLLKLGIVDTGSVNILNGRISLLCPIGKAISDRKVGETVEVVAPAGTFHYTINKIDLLDPGMKLTVNRLNLK